MISAEKQHSPPLCRIFHDAIELIGKRWTGAMIAVMLGGAERFCEIREAVPGLSDRLLTERLKELEEAKIVERKVGEERPPQVTYRLTEKGRALGPVLDAIGAWAKEWKDED